MQKRKRRREWGAPEKVGRSRERDCTWSGGITPSHRAQCPASVNKMCPCTLTAHQGTLPPIGWVNFISDRGWLCHSLCSTTSRIKTNSLTMALDDPASASLCKFRLRNLTVASWAPATLASFLLLNLPCFLLLQGLCTCCFYHWAYSLTVLPSLNLLGGSWKNPPNIAGHSFKTTV